MTRTMVAAIAAVSCMLGAGVGCTPNLVVGTRAPDAAADAADPMLQLDAGRADAAEPLPARDAGGVSDAAPASEVDASMNVDMQDDGGTGCMTDEQCPDSDEPLCKVSEGRCVECLSNANCDANELCEDDGECSARPIPCTSALQCAGSDDLVCHPTLEVCVECATDDQCPGNETCQPNNECD